MTAVLSGILIDEPRRFIPSLPFTSKDEEPPRHPAFNAAEISFFAPLVAKGLGAATPEEIVTFYQATQQAAAYYGFGTGLYGWSFESPFGNSRRNCSI